MSLTVYFCLYKILNHKAWLGQRTANKSSLKIIKKSTPTLDLLRLLEFCCGLLLTVRRGSGVRVTLFERIFVFSFSFFFFLRFLRLKHN